MKKYNFNAGPSMLPREVIEATAQQCLDFNGSGLSLMEISHRAKDFQPVVDEAVALVKELLQVPEGYSVIFLGGGASLEFCMIPYNFLIKKAAYLNTGVWAKKAMKEAKLFGEVVEVASSADANYTFIPKDWTVPADADYLHITTNNTIYGTEIRKDLDVPVRLIADMSSDIFSRPIDVAKYDAIYAGAQKNLAMAGVTIRTRNWARLRARFPRCSTTAHTSKRAQCSTHLPWCPSTAPWRTCAGLSVRAALRLWTNWPSSAPRLSTARLTATSSSSAPPRRRTVR